MNHLFQATVKIIRDALQSNKTLNDVYPYAEKLCVYVTTERFHSSGGAYTCPGLIHSYGPVVCQHCREVRIRHTCALL